MPYGYQQYGSGLMGLQPGFQGLASGIGQRAQQRLDPEYRQQLFQYPEDWWNYDRGGWLPGTPAQLRMGMNPVAQQNIPPGEGGALPENMQFQNNLDPFLQRFMQMLMGQQGGQQPATQAPAQQPPQQPYMPPTYRDMMLQNYTQQPPRMHDGGAVEDEALNPLQQLIAAIKGDQAGPAQEVPIIVRDDEYILNAEAVTALGGSEVLDQVNQQAQAVTPPQPRTGRGQQPLQSQGVSPWANAIVDPRVPENLGTNVAPTPAPTPSTRRPAEESLQTVRDIHAGREAGKIATSSAPGTTEPASMMTAAGGIADADQTAMYKGWVSRQWPNDTGVYGTDYRIADRDVPGWVTPDDAPGLNGNWRILVPAGAQAIQPSTPQNIGGVDEAGITPSVLADPLAVVEETAPITSYQKGHPVTKPEKAVPALPSGETVTPGAAPREMPGTEFRQHHQPFGLDQEYLRDASPEDAMIYMEAAARNRAPSAILSSQRRAMDPSTQQLPPTEVMLNQMIAQYAGVKLTPETIRDARLTNDFNENTQAAREELIGAQARQATVQADIGEGTQKAEIDRLVAVADYTQAQARSLNLETDFLAANEEGQQVLFDYSVEQAKVGNDFYEPMADWTLQNLQANTGLALAQAAAYEAEGTALDTIIADPQAYADLIESVQQLRDDRIRTINQTNQELRMSLDDSGLSNTQKQQVEAEIFRNTFLMQWLTTPGAMEATTLEGLAQQHTNGNVDRLLNRFGWESADEFAKLKTRAAEILSGLDLVAQVLPGMTAFSGSGGATPMPQGGQPAQGSQLPYGGGAMQSGGQGGTDALALYALSVGMPPEELMKMLQAAAGQSGQ